MLEENPNSPKNAVADRELTSEFVEKWDKDLATVHALDSAIKDKGGVFVVKGGLAAEAHAGGRLTRAHNDIDAQFINSSGLTDDQVFEAVEQVVNAEETPWELYKRTPQKIEYREQEDDRPFFNRRRLELEVRTDLEAQPDVRTLINSKGEEITVNVSEFYGLVALKIRKLFMVNDDPMLAERTTNKSDYTDLKRLIELPDYDRDRAIKSLSAIFKNNPNPDQEAQREYDYVVNLLDQL